jgi:hypothetical protein
MDMTPPVPFQINVDATTSVKLNKNATNVVAPTPTKGYKRRGPKILLKERKRRLDLEADEWTAEVTAKSVQCVGCEGTFTLDTRQRRNYYPWNWIKHRLECTEIKRKIALRAEVIVIQ